MDIDEGDSLAAMVRISAEEVAWLPKLAEQALAKSQRTHWLCKQEQRNLNFRRMRILLRTM
jgi:hypothetical protein